jgi:hypothetical protein
MTKPFQFSMRRMFGAVACFCVLAWSLSRLKGVYFIDWLDLLSLAAACISVGGGIGIICGKPVMGVAYGTLAFIVLWLTAPVIINA